MLGYSDAVVNMKNELLHCFVELTFMSSIMGRAPPLLHLLISVALLTTSISFGSNGCSCRVNKEVSPGTI